MLELPLLQSGSLFYADVRISFAADGSFRLLSWRAVQSPAAAADALLQPQAALPDLAGLAQPVQLLIRRLHIDAAVYDAVTVELNKGRWRYVDPLVPSTALSTHDLRANPALFAQDHQLVMMTSAPGRVEEFPLRLENRSYRFCVEKQDEGADQFQLLDASGATVLNLVAGGPCGTIQAQQGLYKVRQTYGGTGSSRTLFMRQRPAADEALTTRPLLQDAGVEEYWGILASFRDASTQRVTRSGFLGALMFLGIPEITGFCAGGVIEARVQATSVDPFGILWASHLFHGLNFFKRIDNDAGMPAKLGGVFSAYRGCAGDATFGMDRFAASDALPWDFPVPLAKTYPDRQSRPEIDHPILIDGFSPIKNTFSLKGSMDGQPESPLGFPGGLAFLAGGGLIPLQPNQVATALPEYRTVLRYRPNGMPEASLPTLGQVALFNSRDCTGAAMVVDNYDLPGIMPGGPLGDFNDSLKLGNLTTATVFSGLSQTGERQILGRSGCISSGWGTSGWKAASLAIQVDTIEIVISSNGCEQCNLAGLDLSSKDLRNGKFYKANLNNAHFSRTNLAGVDLRYASLQGAQLPNANLDAANLCQANLNAAPSTAGVSNVAANLTGAFMRNTNLYGSNMSGANFDNASFFSTTHQGSCQSSVCSVYAKPVCASAYGSVFEGSNFSNAYLVGLDMGSATGNAANFSNSVLNGASFNNTTLTPNLNGTAANFSNAFLQGTDFTAARVDKAVFSNAYVDLAPNGGCMQFELGTSYTAFPDFKVQTPPGSSTCTRAATPAPTCVQHTYNRPTILSVTVATPATPISDARPRNSRCAATAPVCGDAFTGTGPNTCWSNP